MNIHNVKRSYKFDICLEIDTESALFICCSFHFYSNSNV